MKNKIILSVGMVLFIIGSTVFTLSLLGEEGGGGGGTCTHSGDYVIKSAFCGTPKNLHHIKSICCSSYGGTCTACTCSSTLEHDCTNSN